MEIRHYHVPDADCIAEARAVREIYLTDEALFSAFDLMRFDLAYKTNWLAALDTATAQETAETRLDQQKQETQDVLAAMAEGRQVYALVKYFALKAFANKPDLAHKIGLNNYDTAQASQSSFAAFLANMQVQCDSAELKPALLAAGLTQPQIDNIGTVYNKLRDEDAEQTAFIKTSSSATDARVAVYNTAYRFWQQVAEAGKVIFYGNSTKLNEYKLPEGPQPDPDINVKGKVIDSTNGAPLKGVAVKVKELDLETTTNFAGNYSFVSLPAGTYTLGFDRSGYTTQELPITVLATGVVVQNVSLVVI